MASERRKGASRRTSPSVGPRPDSDHPVTPTQHLSSSGRDRVRHLIRRQRAARADRFDVDDADRSPPSATPRPGSILGTRVLRTEDPGLLTGSRQYLADLPLVNRLHAVFVRSDVAHGLLSAIHVDDAVEMPGVVAVHTADNLGVAPHHGFVPVHPDFVRPPLADGKVRFVGEPIAVVLAETFEQGQDAARADLGRHRPTAGGHRRRRCPRRRCAGASSTRTARTWPRSTSTLRSTASAAPTMSPADGSSTSASPSSRWSPTVVPPRSMHDGRLTFWASTQMPHGLHGQLAGALGMDRSDIRVVTAQVGGGFGGKAGIHAEYSVVAAASRLTGRPVQWVPTRSDDMKALPHSRGQVQYVELGSADRRHLHRPAGAPRRRRRRLSDDRRLPAGRHAAHVAGHVRLRLHRVRHRGGGHQHHADGRLPRRGPPRGDRPRGACRRPGRPRTRNRPDRDPQEELPRRRRLPVHHAHREHLRQRPLLAAARPGRRTGRATSSSEPINGGGASPATASCSASASPPTSRSPPAEAPTSSAPSRCTPTDRRRSSPAPCRTGRATRRRTPCWCPSRPASPSTASISSTATPIASAPAAARAAHARCRSVDRPCREPPKRWSTRPRSSPRGCSKPTSPTSWSTPPPARSAWPGCRRRH